ncbi:T9SS C-terminal target domain-containing protein [Bacteroides salyersiae]|uniref:T9SS C-terminal target domain-containing protein n=1 Tax=Bacteroides salyersiae TaxID=291644 RepID=UPI001C390B66|nr:T9SS C-terminal target domain-containing protein [Bacteroides salyersiae]MBV4202933.1 T9SS C-terminal target domain-containing protein [Bacteroides salyersiae]MCB6647969.1 T9SS C-terminal target domain-containing protein [Bacteroides salyersiae]
MKYLLTFSTVFLFCYIAIAQPVMDKDRNIMRSGDRIVKQQMEYKSPGRDGERVLWDFSKLKLIDENYELTYSTIKDSLITGKEHRTLYKYLLSGDTLFSVGYANATTQLSYLKPEIQLIFPFGYQQQAKDYFHATGSYCKRLTIVSQGVVELHADAYGTLILPEGDTLNSVLRIHHTKKIIKHISNPSSNYQSSINRWPIDSIDYYLATDSSWIQTDTYRWYAEGYRYPVFETVENTIYRSPKPDKHFNTAFLYTPSEQYYKLKNDPENAQKREEKEISEEQDRYRSDYRNDFTDQNDIMTYNINTNGNELLVEFMLNQSARVGFMLFDTQGRLLTDFPKENLSKGLYHEKILLENSWPQSLVLRITVNEKIYGIKTVK